MDEVQTINIPIVAFPPFKLRSSLIDKDPVIFQHLLEDYIRLFQKLIVIANSRNLKLSLKSQQQLTVFMKIYLYETSEESTKIFSLGAINPEIVKNQKLLKLIVFQFIKCYNLVNLKIAGDSVWNFCKVYLKLSYENAAVNQSLVSVNVVRSLVEGSIKSKLNSKSDDVSLIRALQDHLILLLTESKLNRADLETLSMLLGQKTKRGVGSSGSKAVNVRSRGARNPSQNTGDFSARFCTAQWIQRLEKLYNRGESVHSKEVFEVMLLSLVSLASHQIARLLQKELSVHSKPQFAKSHPLVAKIVLSKKFQEMNPDLKEKLSFLESAKKTQQFDPKHIQSLADLFPQLNEAKAKTLLVENGGSVENAINKLLEDPEKVIRNTREYKEARDSRSRDRQVTAPQVPPVRRSVYTNNDVQSERVQFGKKELSLQEDADVAKELKKKTLSDALRLLYESDEDEPDDTYDDQEVVKPASSRTSATDFEKDGEFEETRTINQAMDATERKLFEILKRDPEALDRKSRYTSYRSQLKMELKWTDEQIEGWARMLERNPRRYKLLEEQLFNDQMLNGGTLNGHVHAEKGVEKKEKGGVPTKQQLANKNKNKSKQANHNRKAGHDKKMARL